MTDRYEHIAERLVAIEEELRDLAYEQLREVAALARRRGSSHGRGCRRSGCCRRGVRSPRRSGPSPRRRHAVDDD